MSRGGVIDPIIAWQVDVDADAQAYAGANGMQIITGTSLGALWNALLQACNDTLSGVLATDIDGNGIR